MSLTQGFPGATLEELTERRREQNRIAQARKVIFSLFTFLC